MVFDMTFQMILFRNDSLDTSRLAEMISQAFCLALTSCLDQLFDNGFTKIGLRINLDSDKVWLQKNVLNVVIFLLNEWFVFVVNLKVGYEVGSNGTSLPSQYTQELDAALIPVIMDNISSGIEDQVVMELLFHILVK